MKITIYTKPDCVYCDMAKRLLKSKGMEYTENVIGSDISREEFLEIVPDAKTVPQIFVDERLVGGYREFYNEIGGV